MDSDEKDVAEMALATLHDPQSVQDPLLVLRNAVSAASRPESFSSAQPLVEARHDVVLALNIVISKWPTPDERKTKIAIHCVEVWINALQAHK
jgi:hypothetical protein